MAQASDELKSIVARITEYLSNGGLFNPELMDAEKVSRLLIDSRDAITAYLSTVEKPVAVREPGFDWTVSPETDQTMRDIDESIRAAHVRASTTFVGSTPPASATKGE